MRQIFAFCHLIGHMECHKQCSSFITRVPFSRKLVLFLYTLHWLSELTVFLSLQTKLLRECAPIKQWISVPFPLSIGTNGCWAHYHGYLGGHRGPAGRGELADESACWGERAEKQSAGFCWDASSMTPQQTFNSLAYCLWNTVVVMHTLNNVHFKHLSMVYIGKTLHLEVSCRKVQM